LASSLPAGDDTRRAILAGLQKSAKSKRFVGVIDNTLYAIQIEGVNSEFAKTPLGRSLGDWQLVEEWKKGAKEDWVSTKPRKGQEPLRELKRWLASVNPREVFAKWDLRNDDDMRLIYYK